MSFVFTQCPLSVPGSHPGHYIALNPVFFGSSWLWSFLRLLVFDHPDSWKSTGQVFKQHSSISVCRMFSLRSDRGYGFGEEDHRGQVPFSSHLLKGRSYQCDLCWHWPWSPSWGCVYQIPPLKSHSLWLTFPHCPLGGIHYKVTDHTWWMGVMVLLERSVYRSHLEFFCVWNMSILQLEKCIGGGVN